MTQPTTSLVPDFPTPRAVDGYRLGQLIGSSPSGMTFEARRFPVGGSAVGALVKPRWAADARFVARFATEAFAASIVRHPNLPGVRSIGSDKGFPFLVFDRPEGFPLSDPARGRADSIERPEPPRSFRRLEVSGPLTSKVFIIGI